PLGSARCLGAAALARPGAAGEHAYVRGCRGILGQRREGVRAQPPRGGREVHGAAHAAAEQRHTGPRGTPLRPPAAALHGREPRDGAAQARGLGPREAPEPRGR
ncbi:unnamed protein product, partial [Prorocentrum cordatum]